LVGAGIWRMTSKRTVQKRGPIKLEEGTQKGKKAGSCVKPLSKQGQDSLNAKGRHTKARERKAPSSKVRK